MTPHISALVRFRPLTPSEAAAGPPCAAEGDPSIVSFASPTTTATFPFDGVLGPATTQADAFSHVADVVDGVLEGRSGSIIAYGERMKGIDGNPRRARSPSPSPRFSHFLSSLPSPGPTGSGKTHTLFGSGGTGPEADGIIARAVGRLGAGLGAAAASSLAPATPPLPSSLSPSPSVTVSVIEVYRERVFCLLSPGRPEVSLTAGGAGGGCVGLAGAAAVPATSASAVQALISTGVASRSVGSTASNDRSSRSHCIVFVRLMPPWGGPPSVLALADLAGSERTGKAKTAPGSAAFEEGRLINQSLAALGNVISALATASPAGGGENGTSAPSTLSHTPFRASKLTRLLQGLLGGRARTAFLVCASGAASEAGETLSALRFGARARGVAAGVMTDIGSSVPGRGRGNGGGGEDGAATARRAVAAAVSDAASARAALAKERAGRAVERAAAKAHRVRVAWAAAGWAVVQAACVAGLLAG